MITDPESQTQPLDTPYQQVGGATAYQPSAFSPDKHLPNLLILKLIALMVFTTLIPLFVDMKGIGVKVFSLMRVGCYIMSGLAFIFIVIETIHRCNGIPDGPITPGKTRVQEIKPWLWLSWAFFGVLYVSIPMFFVWVNEAEEGRNIGMRWAFALGLILVGLACVCAWVEYTVATALVAYNNHMTQQQQQYQQPPQSNAGLQNPYHMY